MDVKELILKTPHSGLAVAEQNILDGLDLDLLTQLVGITWNQVQPAKARNIVLVVGHTGAGKSTTINDLMGCKMTVTGTRLKPKLSVAEGEIEYAKTGHGRKSQTSHPQVIPAQDIVGLAYTDCPGFGENRSQEQKLCSSLGIPMAIHVAKTVRSILAVVAYEDLLGKGQGLDSLLLNLGGLLKTPEWFLMNQALSSQILFVFTKIPHTFGREDVIELLTECEQEITEDLKGSQTDLEQRLRNLVSELSLSDAFSESNILEKQLNMMLVIRESALKAGGAMKEKFHQLEILFNEIKHLISRLGILKLMLHNENVLFIIRGSENDDKPRLLTQLQQLQSREQCIPKEQFVLDGGEQNDLWDKILHAMATNGYTVIHQWEQLSKALKEFKENRKFSQSQYAALSELLSQLQEPNMTLKLIEKVTVQLLLILLDQENHLKIAIEKKYLEKGSLERTLKKLNTSEPKRYWHRNLDVVHLKGYEEGGGDFRSLPIFICSALLTIPFIIPSILMSYPYLAASYGCQMGIVSEETSNRVDHIFKKMSLYPELRLGLPVLSALLRETHQFYYQDLPFITAKSCHEDPNYDENLIFPIVREAFFDFESKVEQNKEGIYKINFIGGATYSKAWVALFIEKRLHPDIRIQIEKIQRDLESINGSLGNDLQLALAQIQQESKEDQSKLTDDNITPAEKHILLLSIIERNKEALNKKIENTCGKIWGIQGALRNLSHEFSRQANRFLMMERVNEIIETSKYYKIVGDFLAIYQSQLSEIWQHDNTKLFSRSLERIWHGKSDRAPSYEPFREKNTGSAVGAFFQENRKGSEWMGKLGFRSLSEVLGQPITAASKVRRGSAQESLLEKIAGECYRLLSNQAYVVPTYRLAELPIENEFTKQHLLAPILLEEINRGRSPDQKITDNVYVMSKCLKDYHDFAELQECQHAKLTDSFIKILEAGFLPDQANIEGKLVPICGLVEVLAIARLLADPDVIGGTAQNLGYVIERDLLGQPMAVRTIKIDPGFSFSFTSDINQSYQALHPANRGKRNPCDLQYSNAMPAIPWKNLTPLQHHRFLMALKRGLIYLSEHPWESLFYHAEFKNTPSGRALTELDLSLVDELKENAKRQEGIYGVDLKQVETLFESYSSPSCTFKTNK